MRHAKTRHRAIRLRRDSLRLALRGRLGSVATATAGWLGLLSRRRGLHLLSRLLRHRRSKRSGDE